MKRCPECNSENPATAKYCTQCNTLLDGSVVQEKSSKYCLPLVDFDLTKDTLAELDKLTKGSKQLNHFMFTGNSRDEKVATAQTLGTIYRDMGLLKSGHVVGADSSNIGAMCDEAIDGIIYVEDANNLTPEAINTLLLRMENDRGKLAIIVAGEKEPMEKWASSNPGISARFYNVINMA